MPAMTDPNTVASVIAKQLNITTATLYAYLNEDRTLK